MFIGRGRTMFEAEMDAQQQANMHAAAQQMAPHMANLMIVVWQVFWALVFLPLRPIAAIVSFCAFLIYLAPWIAISVFNLYVLAPYTPFWLSAIASLIAIAGGGWSLLRIALSFPETMFEAEMFDAMAQNWLTRSLPWILRFPVKVALHLVAFVAAFLLSLPLLSWAWSVYAGAQAMWYRISIPLPNFGYWFPQYLSVAHTTALFALGVGALAVGRRVWMTRLLLGR